MCNEDWSSDCGRAGGVQGDQQNTAAWGQAMFLLVSTCRKGLIQLKLFATSLLAEQRDRANISLSTETSAPSFLETGEHRQREAAGAAKVTVILPLLGVLQ